ncbi:MAG: 23S rRNA (uracil(1939)-C(5))-methyltransferase RlmD [bacterium]|nr:23S rRNA (uracil(1939)-C(5))-methyltransferase RlmD [bacterium]
MRIILASGSERRKQLIKKIFSDFEVVVPSINEISDETLGPEELAVLNARLKAENVAKKIKEKDCLIISADTIVAVKDRILGKPENYEVAFSYLKMLSGTVHRVITGCCLYHPSENKFLTDFEVSLVKFKKLNDEQIKNFLNNQTFYDKAGGYAVQEIGDNFVAEIKGSYDNVVGLPVDLIKRMLINFQGLKEIEITDISFPNPFGIGRFNQKTVFIEHAVPGDIVWVFERKNKPNFSYAENCGIKKYSKFRVEPVCQHFGICGGCSLQNLDYKFQLDLKKRYLNETLMRIGKIKNNVVEPVVPSPEIFYYRNKMEYAFGMNDRRIILGLRERQSPLKKYSARVSKINHCPIFSEVVSKIFPSFIDYANKNSLEPYNPFRKEGYLRHLLIRHSKKTNQVMLVLITKSGREIDLIDLINEITSRVPEIVSFFHVENDQISDVVSFQKKHLVWGKSFLEEKIKKFRFRIYPETFFQPNTFAAERLYDIVISFASEVKHERILGLFCGSGPIELILSQIAQHVTGIDNNPINIETAIENCRNNEIRNCEFHCLTSEEFLKKISKNQGKYDLLVVDPPRTGLSKKAVLLIINMKIESIIYVSCNPATLARDIAILVENGYQLKKVVPLDMFPHTTHLETCCLLTRS